MHLVPRSASSPARPSGDTKSGDTKSGNTKSGRTRGRIVDAAAHVLLTRGYAGLRLSDVAEIAEVQGPSIYYYFASRDRLIEEAVAVGLERARTLVVQALDAAAPDLRAIDRLDIAVAAHLSTLLTHSDHAAAAIRTVPQLPADIGERYRQDQRVYLEVWRDLISDARRDGDIPPELDVGTALMVIIGALNWTAEWWDPAQGSLDGVIVAAQRLVRHGLSAP